MNDGSSQRGEKSRKRASATHIIAVTHPGVNAGANTAARTKLMRLPLVWKQTDQEHQPKVYYELKTP